MLDTNFNPWVRLLMMYVYVHKSFNIIYHMYVCMYAYVDECMHAMQLWAIKIHIPYVCMHAFIFQ